MNSCTICGVEIQNKNDVVCEICKQKIELMKKMEMVTKACEKLRKNKFKYKNISDELIENLKSDIKNNKFVFSSIPEVAVAVQMLLLGLEFETQKKIGDKKVDFYIPELKLILEIDGKIYHTNENEAFIRDRHIMHHLGEEWEIVHIDDSAVPKYTWNLTEALPYIISQRNEKYLFRDSCMDTDFLEEFYRFERYLGGCKKNDNTGLFKPSRKT